MRRDDGPVATSWTPPWLRVALVGIAGLYLFVLGLANVGTGITQRLPAVPRYFTQTACLFPRATSSATEYKVHGWSCEQRKWIPIDHRPDFPLHSEHKESRFHRLAYFYWTELSVMQALDEYLRARNAARGLRLGGIHLWSLRRPIPPVGDPVERWRSREVDEYPKEQRGSGFRTGSTNREARCAPEGT
jgi:hypothetical protein